MANAASRIFNIMKKSGNDTISELVHLKVKTINPLTLTLDDRVILTEEFFELSNRININTIKVNDILLGISLNGGQKYLIQENSNDATGSGGLPPGGFSGEVLAKQSNDDFDAKWQNIASLSKVGDTLPIGAVVEFASDKIPDNWLLCNGQAVSRTVYSELFSIIGTIWGAGDGSTTFNLPTKEGLITVGKKSGDSNFDSLGKTGGNLTHTHTQGATGGSTSNTGAATGNTGAASGSTGAASGNTGAASGNTGSTTLTTDQIPSHKHSLRGYNNHGANSGSAIAVVDLPTNGTEYGTRALSCDTASSLNGAMSNTGGGKGHTHTLNSHTHTLNSHTHTLNSHTHSLGSHTHTVDSHTHTNPTTNSSSSLQPYVTSNFIIKAKQSTGVVADVVDSLNSDSATNALSAKQGKILDNKINTKSKELLDTINQQNKNLTSDIQNSKSRFVSILPESITTKGVFELTESVHNFDEIHVYATGNVWGHRRVCTVLRTYYLSQDFVQLINLDGANWENGVRIYYSTIDTNDASHIGTSNWKIVSIFGVKY